ncbi:hypothetical protein [Yersinia sp. 2466 StPb PI]|uniref:hypothetical protein n=1 Tax=Yersinia sp. 2466 StPb PI TaxID=3061648 RepID=UPI00355B3B6C
MENGIYGADEATLKARDRITNSGPNRSILHAMVLKYVLSMTMLLLANENDTHTVRCTF